MPRRSQFHHAGRPAGLLSTLTLAVLMLAGGSASAQSDKPGDQDGAATAQALTRLREATQPRTLSAEGQTLLDRDVIKLDGYAYCGQATSLAEQG